MKNETQILAVPAMTLKNQTHSVAHIAHCINPVHMHIYTYRYALPFWHEKWCLHITHSPVSPVTLKSFRTLHKSCHSTQEEFYCGMEVVTFSWLATHPLPCNKTIVLLTWIWILSLFSVSLNSVCLSRFILKWTWHSWTTSCPAKFFLVVLILTHYRFDRELFLDVCSCNSFPLR